MTHHPGATAADVRSASDPPHDDAELSRGAPRGVPTGFSASLRLASFVAPAAFGIWHEASGPSWDGDVGTLGVFAGAARFQGVVSALLGQLAQALPVGSGHERAALPGALALGALGVMVFELSVAALGARQKAPRMNALLAFAAALGATLSGRSLAQGTLLGSAALPAALALGTLVASGMLAPLRRARPLELDARRSLLVAALLSLTLLESVWAAAILLPASLVGRFLRGGSFDRRHAVLFAGTLAGTLALGALPAALGPLLQGAEAAPLAASLSGAALDASVLKTTWGAPVGAVATEAASGLFDVRPWLDALGLFTLAAALLGGVVCAFEHKLRPLLAAGATLLAGDLLIPRASEHLLSTSGRDVLELVASAVLVLCASVGTQAVVQALGQVRFGAARPAQALLVAFVLALGFAGAEDSAQRLSARNERGLEAWTDEALATLPARSLVVVRSETIAYRLWAATALGDRPDVLVVPLPLLGRGTLAADLLALEPKLALLIRELSISGLPSEQALTELADTRPLFVDVDPSWDKRLLDHLEPGPFFCRFAPHALGRSDREAALAASVAPFDRVVANARVSVRPDRATLLVLARGAEQELGLLEVLGDRADAERLRQRLGALLPGREPARAFAGPGPVALR